MNFLYTLAFLKKRDEILLVNRQKQPWKGAWNGVGGKRQKDETPLSAIIREVYEETQIDISSAHIEDKGILTWNSFDALGQGLHIFLIHLKDDFQYVTPISTAEGILDWKHVDWINDFENYGVAHNIPYFLPTVLSDKARHHFHCIFEAQKLIKVTKEKLI